MIRLVGTEFAVYCHLSGDTHILDGLSGLCLERINKGPLSAGQLLLDLENDLEVDRQDLTLPLKRALASLEAEALIKRSGSA